MRESDVAAFRNQTVRLMIANAAVAEQRRDVLERYLQAYRETLDWMYSDPAALKAYAEWVNVSEALAKEVRDQFYPKDNLRLDRLSGLDEAMADAVSMKFLAAPLTKQQQDDLFKYYARGHSSALFDSLPISRVHSSHTRGSCVSLIARGLGGFFALR